MDFDTNQERTESYFSDIANLYLRFFEFNQMQARIVEIKIISKNHLYQNFPFLVMLFKWLVELSRDQFQEACRRAHLQTRTQENRLENTQNYSTITINQTEPDTLQSFLNHEIANLTSTTVATSEKQVQPFRGQTIRKNRVYTKCDTPDNQSNLQNPSSQSLEKPRLILVKRQGATQELNPPSNLLLQNNLQQQQHKYQLSQPHITTTNSLQQPVV